MLLRLDAGLAGGGLAEANKTADLVAEFGQSLIVGMLGWICHIVSCAALSYHDIYLDAEHSTIVALFTLRPLHFGPTLRFRYSGGVEVD